MNNLAKEKQQQLLFVAMMTAIVLGILWFFVVDGQKKTLATVQKRVQEAQSKVDNAQKTIKRAALIQEELEAKQAELRDREASMASGDLYQWFLGKMIPATSARPLEFNANPPLLVDAALLPKFPYRAAAYGVKITGYFHDFGKFLADIENEFPYARIQNLDIVAQPAAAGTEKLNFAFEFVTLYHTNRAISTQ